MLEIPSSRFGNPIAHFLPTLVFRDNLITNKYSRTAEIILREHLIFGGGERADLAEYVESTD